MQNFCDIALSSESFMNWDLSIPEGESNVPLHSAHDLTSFLYENAQRPRDLSLLFLEKNLGPHGQSVPVDITGDLTPPHPGGLTPTNMSRSTSPAWSESSGSMSASSVSGGTIQENQTTRRSNPLPRHKRPAHKRAEIKRRDKIKVHNRFVLHNYTQASPAYISPYTPFLLFAFLHIFMLSIQSC